MFGEQPALLIVGSLSLLALLLVFWQLQAMRKLRREIKVLRSQFADQAKPEPTTPVNFSTSLDEVERQQLQSAQSTPPRNSADKYRYVGSLADQGLDAKGIAEALQMSTAEVEQLLRLAKLKQTAAAE